MDDELRDLERRYAARGDPELGALWLAARVRAGTLDPDVSRDSAWAGEEVARRAHPDVVPHDDPRDPAALVRGLRSRSGAVLAATVALDAALARSSTQRFQRSGVISGTRQRELVAGIREAELRPIEERTRRHLACARLITADGPDRGETELERIVLSQRRRAQPGDLILADLVDVAAIVPSTAAAIERAAAVVASVANQEPAAADGAVVRDEHRERIARDLHGGIARLIRDRPYHERR